MYVGRNIGFTLRESCVTSIFVCYFSTLSERERGSRSEGLGSRLQKPIHHLSFESLIIKIGTVACDLGKYNFLFKSFQKKKFGVIKHIYLGWGPKICGRQKLSYLMTFPKIYPRSQVSPSFSSAD